MELGNTVDGPTPVTGTNYSQMQETNIVKSIQDFLSDDSSPPNNSGERWQFVLNSLDKLTREIGALKTDNLNLKSGLASANGKIAFLENQVERAKKKIGELEWKEMQNDLVFYNVEESLDISDEGVAVNEMTNNLRIKTDLIYSDSNQGGQIKIDNVFRMGKRLSEKYRPLVVSLTTQKAKRLVMEHYRKAQKTIQTRIADHLPSEMREHRTVHRESYQKYKKLYHDTDTKVKLIKDKLIVGSKVVEEPFQNNPLVSSPTNFPKPHSSLKHTELKEINGSTFQGHAGSVTTVAEAASAKDSLFQISTVAHSDHVIYAYSIMDPSGMKIVGNNDGGEWAASKMLVNLIEEKGLTNIFLAVTRKHAGPNLGRKRFTYITKMATKAIEKL